MSTHRRDALLAAAVLVTLVGVLVVEHAVETLWNPAPAAGGVVIALLVEIAFLRSESIARHWKRPAIQIGSTAALLVGGLLSYLAVGPPIIAVLCWGLATYFLLLAAVLGLGRNPLTSAR